jgi:branched-chain amino acid transport system permease protein
VAGAGGYTFAVLAIAGWPTLVAVGVALGLSALVGSVLLSAQRRVVGPDFALFSFCIQVAWVAAVLGLTDVTGGALGLSGVPALLPFSSRETATAGLALGILMLFWVAARREQRSCYRVGAVTVARSSELGATLGLPVGLIRLQAGAFYGAFLGAAGVLLASYLSFVGPSGFDTSMAVLVLGVALLGRRSVAATALAALVLVGLPEAFRLFGGVGAARAGYLRLALAGMAVVVAALHEPSTGRKP